MRAPKLIQDLVRCERAVLVVVVLPDEQQLQDENLEELENLAATAGAKVVGSVIQRRQAPHPTFYVGKGKTEDIREIAGRLDADVIVVDHDLTPAQVRNLERLIDRKVVDRSELVLDIFATHAKTAQAKTQVELAQLEYTLPRLRRMWSHLSRYEGGIGVRGPGETQLETDRRLVRKRVSDLKKRLAAIELRKQGQVQARNDRFTVCLVGYTNAGKSSIMNALTGADVHVSDTPFATLDTKTSVLELAKGEEVLISDTVGFIRNLPHHLVASFHATLEEALQADLLLHVVDLSSPAAPHHVDVVDEVLKELGCEGTKTLAVLNKIDREREPGALSMLKAKAQDHVMVSARTGEGLDELCGRIREYVDELRVAAEVVLAAADGRTMAYLLRNAVVHSRDYFDGKVRIELSIERRFIQKARKLNPLMQVTIRGRSEKPEPVGSASG